MNLIVAVDENWAIGNKGKLLVSIPSDMKFFREETSGEGKVVILGRKTLETFPGGRPLKNRVNVILTKTPDLIFLSRTELPSPTFFNVSVSSTISMVTLPSNTSGTTPADKHFSISLLLIDAFSSSVICSSLYINPKL